MKSTVITCGPVVAGTLIWSISTPGVDWTMTPSSFQMNPPGTVFFAWKNADAFGSLGSGVCTQVGCGAGAKILLTVATPPAGAIPPSAGNGVEVGAATKLFVNTPERRCSCRAVKGVRVVVASFRSRPASAQTLAGSPRLRLASSRLLLRRWGCRPAGTSHSR